MSCRASLQLQSLESRDVPSGNQLFAIGEDAGSRVEVFSAAGPSGGFDSSGELLVSFEAYPGFTGGVRVAVGDVTGDGVEDLVTAAGPGGGPHIKVFDGHALLAGNATLVAEFYAFAGSFHGGVYVAIGQFDPSTTAQEIVVGAGAGGGPHLRIFALNPLIFIIAPPPGTPIYEATPQSEFFAFAASFPGGVRVAAADTTGDGRAEAITAAGPGGGPHVRVWDVFPPNPLTLPPFDHIVIDEFFAYGSSFRGGVYVSAGELNGDATSPEIVTGAGEGGGPHVRVWQRTQANTFVVHSEFFAGDPRSTLGTRVGVANLSNLTDRQSIYTAVGPGFQFLLTVIPPADPRLGAFTFENGQFARKTLLLPGDIIGPYDRGLNVVV